MGLDQYAYKRTKTDSENSEPEHRFYWRKHAKLQEWMERLYSKRVNHDTSQLNCGELELFPNDIHELEYRARSRTLPKSPGGFFYGHQIQDETAEEDRQQDLEFCAWAKVQLKAGHRVFYSCWY